MGWTGQAVDQGGTSLGQMDVTISEDSKGDMSGEDVMVRRQN